MAFIIQANNKAYTVTDHAALRMLQRYISEALVVQTLEKGSIMEQPHGTDLYEYETFDETLEAVIVIQVVVNEDEKTIVSVIDNTEAN